MKLSCGYGTMALALGALLTVLPAQAADKLPRAWTS